VSPPGWVVYSEGDTWELREGTAGKSTIVLMGHSTGTQDIMTYLLTPHPHPPTIAINGAILQAPVSDRQALSAPQHIAAAAVAREMVDQGRGEETLDVRVGRGLGVGGEWVTARRWWSLVEVG
jgi:hypothetical protein